MNQPGWEGFLAAWPLSALATALHATLSALAAGCALLLPAAAAWAAHRRDAGLQAWVRRRGPALAAWLPGLAALATGLLAASSAPAVAQAVSGAQPLACALVPLAWATALLAGLLWGRALGERQAGGGDPGAPRLALGWLAAVAALVALLATDAVLAWMADPDARLDQAGLARALAAPLLGPALATRLLAAVAAAGLSALVSARREPPEARRRLAGVGAALAGLGVAGWAVAAEVTLQVATGGNLEVVEGEIPVAALAYQVAAWSACLLVVGLALAAWVALRPDGLGRLAAGLTARSTGGLTALAVVLALLASGSAEVVREAARRPWAIGSGRHGALYASGFTPDQVASARVGGLRALPGFSVPGMAGDQPDQAARGRLVFDRACSACHALGGPGGLAARVDGLPREAIAASVRRLDRLVGRMPPFPGTPADQEDLVYFLAGLDGVVESPAPPLPPEAQIAAGRRVLEYRCLTCHRDVPLRPRVHGVTADLAYELVGRLPKLNPGMPAFAGSDEDRRDLAAYLAALGAGKSD